MEPTFFFAWVDAGTAFDPGTHNREDEKVVRWRVEHLEGEFATLSIDIRNPRIGLLNAGRKLWAWLAWDNAGTSVPLFFGRLVALAVEFAPRNRDVAIPGAARRLRITEIGTRRQHARIAVLRPGVHQVGNDRRPRHRVGRPHASLAHRSHRARRHDFRLAGR